MRHSTLLVLGIAALPLLAQKPVINPGGVVNAASFAAVDGPSHGLVPGAIASIFGRSLAAGTATAGSYPLPRTLAATSVTVNGVSAPLFYVSPGQINFQVPFSTNRGSSSAYGQASIIVATPAGASEPLIADTWFTSPGIFTQDGSGCGPGAVVNVKPDGSRSLNSPSNSASPGDYLEVYGTGLGQTYNVPPDGMPAPADPLEKPLYEALGLFGLGLSGLFGGYSTFTAGAPGLVGVDQVNLLLPPFVQQGCAVPLQFNTQYLKSQPVTVSIQAGGGQCVDPPVVSAGAVVLKKSVVLNDSTIPESDTLTISFTASPGQTVPMLPFSESMSASFNVGYYQGPGCPVPGYRTLNPGELTVTGPGGAQARVQPVLGESVGTSTGRPIYQASLPSGFLQAGAYRVSSAGGADVGAFEITVNMGPGIQVTTQFPKGRLAGANPFTVNWTGGQPGTGVEHRVISHSFPYDLYFETYAPATAGTVGLPDSIAQASTLRGDVQIEIDLLVSPNEPLPTFPVPGLTLGTQVRWIYEYRFIGLQ